jgi:hypothetical protein
MSQYGTIVTKVLIMIFEYMPLWLKYHVGTGFE